MTHFINNSKYERAKRFLKRRSLDEYAQVPELLLAMVEHAEEVRKADPRQSRGRL